MIARLIKLHVYANPACLKLGSSSQFPFVGIFIRRTFLLACKKSEAFVMKLLFGSLYYCLQRAVRSFDLAAEEVDDLHPFHVSQRATHDAWMLMSIRQEEITP